MIYCDFIKLENDYAVYAFGCNTENITGEAKFFNKMTQPIIIKQPKGKQASEALLSKLVIKYKEQLLSGNFPKKMSYES